MKAFEFESAAALYKTAEWSDLDENADKEARLSGNYAHDKLLQGHNIRNSEVRKMIFEHFACDLILCLFVKT